MNRKEIIKKMERFADTFFSERFQNKLYMWVFGFMGVVCFICGFWNYGHFVFSAICGITFYVLKKAIKNESEKK